MAESWDTNFNISYTDFIFLGFSGSKEWRQLLLIIFTVTFSISVPANIILISTIISTKSLHAPMYILIGILSAVDLCAPVIFIPNLLYSLILNFHHISRTSCLLQMFCIHFLGYFQSTILLWMAVDRYFAICRPLHYTECMSFTSFYKFVIFPAMRNLGFVLAIVGMAARRSYCKNEINHCFCEHMALVSLTCGSPFVNSTVGIIGTFVVRMLDFLLITVSYGKIFYSVFKSGNISQKALSTCLIHICVMITGLTFALTAFLAYRVKTDLPMADRIILSTLYLFCPNCMHPIIYGYMFKEIRVNVIKTLTFWKNNSNFFIEKISKSAGKNQGNN